jgi:5-methyltetrahydrofolate--homocysteine methyltransferase
MSALLTTTMTNMPVVIDALKNAGLRDSVKVLIGGAPVTKAYADQIGADGYAPDASQAAKLALSFVS